ncbi:DUF6970 domain-containing protein [Hymenobacter volaticus]|uniref:DUF6970 domain-containing protein n=1 Tax=Hymenobacter volaticus TaxID=2932254 RepID=A0ABY4G4D9_9BACT|nr:hypothetical protein [Hymenobacter volaticus]UOQ65745.1 hypothetical protein MUN86_19785 [Hymenobacter volaticus]
MNRFFTCLLTSLLLLGTMGGCSTSDAEASLSPVCPDKISETLITQLSQEPKRTPVAEITQYTYLGQTVYLVTGGGATTANGGSTTLNYLFDTCGNVLCAASGGANNQGDGRCPDFKANATNPVLVWRDSR